MQLIHCRILGTFLLCFSAAAGSAETTHIPVSPDYHDERVVYAVRSITRAGQAGSFIGTSVTTLYAWNPRTHRRETLYSDRDTLIALQYALGSGGFDQRGVIVVRGTAAFAIAFRRIASQSESTTDQRAGSLYELALDGSNRTKWIADIRSFYGNDKFAVSPDATRFAYMALRDASMGRLSPWLVVINKDGATLTDRAVGPFDYNNISWLEWTEDGQRLRGVLTAPEYEGAFSMAPDGTDTKRWDLVPGRLREEFPDYSGDRMASPSGRYLAFMRHGASASAAEIWIVGKDRGKNIYPESPELRTYGTLVVHNPPRVSDYYTLLGWLPN